jgi:thiamine biosynthesis lipoprotein
MSVILPSKIMNLPEITLVRQTQNHMATIFDFRISCQPEKSRLADRILHESHLLVSQLESELSEFRNESPVFRLNQSSPSQRVGFTQSGLELLQRADYFRKLSHGAFDHLAKSSDVEPRISWDLRTQEAWKETQGTWLGFGAIGKGYALDRVCLLIELAGFENYLLSAGGSSIVISGHEAPSSPWRWGWSWKKDKDERPLGIPFDHTNGKKVALGISGTHEQGEHILKIRENLIGKNLKSALVATRSAADADALSTAMFASGGEASGLFLNELLVPPATAWIDHDEVPHWNGIFQQFWRGLQIIIVTLFISKTIRADDTVDLNNLGDAAKSFTPYVFERNHYWVLLPIFTFLAVLLHLKNTKPKRDYKKLMKKNLTSTLSTLLVASLTWLSVESARAVVIEPLGKAVANLLGTTKAMTKTLQSPSGAVTVYYAVGSDGKANKVVFIQKGLYKPDCTHTWAVGMNPATGKVAEVRVVEMACPHAYPTKSASFLDQYKGKGPADVATLDSDIHTVAKATGTSVLATEAVKNSITTLAQNKGQF